MRSTIILLFLGICLEFSPKIFAQQSSVIQISGTVTSADDGLGLPSVNIIEVGTTNGVVTDLDGNYSINVNKGAQLSFSFIGFATQVIPIEDQSTVDVVMSPDIAQLEQVIVVGYGTQKKSDVTGAVAYIGAEDLTVNPLPSVDQALQGKLAGVNIVNNSGDPGGGVSVRIRGEGTIGNSDPLYVIDGIPVVNNSSSEIPFSGSTGKVSNPLANLNPNDIESIDILKDASAAAIYGVRGANGVVIITTKKGKSGAPSINFDSYLAFKNVKKLDMLKARDYADLILEMFDNAGEAIDADNEPTNLLDNSFIADRGDWQEEFFKTGVAQNYNLGVSGGTDNMDYSVSGGYLKEEATTVGSGFQRYNLRINTNFNIGKFRLGEAISLSRTNNRRAPFLAARSQLRTLTQHAPTVAIYNSENEGGFGGPGDGDGYNRWNTVGLASLTEHNVRRNRLIGSVYGEYEIIDGLTYKLNLGLDAIFTNGTNFVPSYTFSNAQFQENPSLRDYNAEELSPLIENTLNFSRTFDDHDLTILAGYTQQKYTFSRYSAFSDALQSNDLRTLNTSRADAQVSLSGFDDEWAIRSMLGRINYSYKGKYLFTGNIRRDGSSRFSKENRYGVFPSFSVGWNIGKEDFLKDSKLISYMKLRLGYGELGNQEVPPYGFQSTLITSGNYVFGGGLQSGVTQTTIANENLKWETSVQKNIGLDLGLLENQLQFNVEYFIKETKDIILRAPLPGSLGISDLPLVNAGNIENRGLEIMAVYRGVLGDLKMEIGANASFLSNTVKSLGIGLPIEGRFPDSDGPILQVIREGETINSFFGHVTDGIFQTASEVESHASQFGAAPGDIRFKDLDNNGVIDDNDRTILGDPVPDLTYGFNTNFGFHNLDLSIFFQGVQGVDIYNGLRYWNEGLSEVYNHSTASLGRWTGPNTSSTIPRAVLGDPNFNRRPSDRYLEDGSYLRLKNITLGYSLPTGILGSDGFIKSLRVYFSGQNLLTFTDYTGYDPEIGTGFNQGVEVANQGVDYGIIPQPKVFLTGLQIKF